MSDIISIRVGEVWRSAGMVKKVDGAPITSGTVNYYLKALTGDDAGKWWKDADETWDAAETANAMTHQADGNWTIQLTSSPFAAGVVYLEYAKESGDLHVPAEGRMLRGVVEGADTAGTTALLGMTELDEATRVFKTSAFPFEADADIETKIDTIDALLDLVAVPILGDVTGAGTGTEVFVYAGNTVTATVDEDGNRTNVFS